MEWVLQVVDEIDDAVAMLRHGWLGVASAAAAGLKLRLSLPWARPWAMRRKML
jgi:hypothetical protein